MSSNDEASNTVPHDTDLHVSSTLTQQEQSYQYHRYLHLLSIGTLIATPIILALPPRKLDLYSFALSGAFVVAAGHQTRSRTGHSIMGLLGETIGARKDYGNDLTSATASQPSPLSPVTHTDMRESQRDELQAAPERGRRLLDRWAIDGEAHLGADGLARLKTLERVDAKTSHAAENGNLEPRFPKIGKHRE